MPITVDEEGYLHGVWPMGQTDGVPTETIEGVQYSPAWYCGLADHPGLVPDATVETYLRSSSDTPYEWQAETHEPGERLHVSDFADYETWGNGIGSCGLGKPAMATWRSHGPEPFPVQVVRSARVSRLAEEDDWLDASTTDGFVAWSASCPKQCAVTTFEGHVESEQFDAGDLVYCPKHQSPFDPFDIVSSSFVANRADGE